MQSVEIAKHTRIKLKTGDEVIVIAGREKGKRGEIMFIDKPRNRVVVQGVNKIKRFQRPTQENPQGGVIEIEQGLHLSNVMYYDAKAKQGRRLGYKVGLDGAKFRAVRMPKGELKEIKEKGDK
ncbi:MAG: 50S ribosomal protein L24 [Leptospirales bacterium]